MSESFSDRFGNLTVEEALELNRIAKQTCEFETTCESEE